MTISKDTIRDDFFNEVYDVINTKVSDPLNRNKQWIFSNTNAITNADTKFVGFPIIVIQGANIESDRPTFDNDYENKGTPLIITVYTTNIVLLDTLSDSVAAVVNTTNFPQFDFKDKTEKTDVADFGDRQTSIKCQFRKMSYFVEVQKVG